MKRVKCPFCEKKFKTRGIKNHQRFCRAVRVIQSEAARLKDLQKPEPTQEMGLVKSETAPQSYRARETQIQLANSFAKFADTFAAIFGEWRY
jgi:hypothetical protein